MASEIKVDTIVNAGGDNDTGIDLATNDQILLKVANATRLTMNSTGQTTIVGEGGTTTTSVQQGLCKAWCRFDDGSSSDSFNIASVTDHGTGDYQVFIANDMANATYTASLMFGENGGSGVLRIGNRDIAAGSVGVVGTNGAMSSAQDVNRCGIDVSGDLA